MGRLDDLLETIRERPDDDALRLVYADALEEAGETIRAEYIRSAINDDPRRAILERDHRETIIGPLLSQHAHQYQLERGLVSVLYTFVTPMLEHGPELLRAGAIRFLGFRDARTDGALSGDAGTRIAELPALRYVTGLSLPMANEFLDPLLSSPHFDRVTDLELNAWPPVAPAKDVESIDLLARPILPALRRLRLVVGEENEDVLRALRRQCTTVLSLQTGRGVADRFFEIIAGSPIAEGLAELALWGMYTSSITAKAFGAFARSPGLRSLRSLSLWRIEIDDEALTALADLHHIRLRRLSIGDRGLPDIEPFLRSPACAALEELELVGQAMNDQAVEALIAWPGAVNLQRLELGSSEFGRNAMTPAGWSRLRTTAALAKCKVMQVER